MLFFLINEEEKGMKKHLFFLLSLTLLHLSLLSAECCRGKVDFAPAFVHIDVLESGHTVSRMDMLAFKTDATILIKKGYGFCVKPTLLCGTTGRSHGDLISGGVGLGHCTPINDKLTVTPSFGVIFTQIRTRTSIPFLGLHHLKEKFRSTSPYLGLDVTYTFLPCWRICAMYQYAWSHTHTKITGIGSDKSRSDGPNYGIMLEHDLRDNLSVQLGAAYNITLSKEKHGLRGTGVKAGIAYWF
jgi:hypothetical protein